MKKIFGTCILGASTVALASCASQVTNEVILTQMEKSELSAYVSHTTETIGTSSTYGDGTNAETTEISTSNMSFGVLGGGETEVALGALEGATEVDGFAELLKVDVEFDAEGKAFIETLNEAYNSNTSISENILDTYDETKDSVIVEGITYDSISKVIVCSADLDTDGLYWTYDHTNQTIFASYDGESCGEDKPVLNTFYKVVKGSDADIYRYVERENYSKEHGNGDSSHVQLDILFGHKHDAGNDNVEQPGTDFDISTRSVLVPHQDGIGYELETQVNSRKAFDGSNITNREIANVKSFDKKYDSEDYEYTHEYRIYTNGVGTAFSYKLDEGTSIENQILAWEGNVPVGLTVNFDNYDRETPESEVTLQSSGEIGIWYNGDGSDGNPKSEDGTPDNHVVFKMSNTTTGEYIAPINKQVDKSDLEEQVDVFLNDLAAAVAFANSQN